MLLGSWKVREIFVAKRVGTLLEVCICKFPVQVCLFVCCCMIQTDMTGLQLQSMEAKSMSDLSKKDSIITALEAVSNVILLIHVCAFVCLLIEIHQSSVHSELLMHGIKSLRSTTIILMSRGRCIFI